jgi:hypothetical protein
VAWRTSLLCSLTGHLRRFYLGTHETKRGRREGVITAVRVMLTRAPFLLNVSNLTVRSHFPIATGDASASESRESEEAN